LLAKVVVSPRIPTPAVTGYLLASLAPSDTTPLRVGWNHRG